MQLTLALAPIALSFAAFPMQSAPSVQSTPAAQATPSEADENPDERICRPMPAPTGSRLGASQRCATRAQWRDFEINRAFARRGVEQIQRERVCRQNDCR